ncbi:MAG: 3-hydroxyacyl-CoA dehydrogenase [Gammaproteobacteria bacterium]
MKDFATDPLTIGIIGAGAMGRGIAQLAATAGLTVMLNDVAGTASEAAVEFIHKMLDRAVEKGRMSSSDADNSKACITISPDLAGLAGADLVIEAVVEKLEVKQALFEALQDIVSEECILASNTSSLSITAVATACEKQGRVAGCHFFNPVPLMKLVEVVAGLRTQADVIEQLLALVKRMGHTPVSVNDSPGFLVNHTGRGLNTEGLRIIFERICAPHVVDAVVRDCIGLRMGPFELMDLTALDVTWPVSEQIYNQYFHDPRLRPTPALRQRYLAGLLGRKSGAGFYTYVDGKKLVPEEPPAPACRVNARFWVSQAIPDLAGQIVSLLRQAGADLDTGERPQQDTVAMVTPLGWDTSTACVREHLDPVQTLAVDARFLSDKRICLMTNPATDSAVIQTAWAALAKTGRSVSIIHDSAGFIAQRIVANIVNTACDIAQQGIAAPADIDTGAQLGLGYPKGPLALGDEVGAGVILDILDHMQECYQEPRYRPSPWLRRRAQLGLSLLHPAIHEDCP